VVAKANPLGRPLQPVAHEHIPPVVRVAGDEVRSLRVKSHEVTVVADIAEVALAPRLRAAVADAHPLRRPLQPVAHEYIHLAVRIPGDEVRGPGTEGDE